MRGHRQMRTYACAQFARPPGKGVQTVCVENDRQKRLPNNNADELLHIGMYGKSGARSEDRLPLSNSHEAALFEVGE